MCVSSQFVVEPDRLNYDQISTLPKRVLIPSVFASDEQGEGGPHPSALDDVHRETALAGLLVLRRHVDARLAHGLDDRVERHVMRAVTAQREPGGRDGRRRGDGVPLD